MCNQIGTTFWREKWQIASPSCQEVIRIWKQTWGSNDKTIIELGCRKMSWLSLSRRSIICLSLRLRQIITLLATNHDILLSLVQLLLIIIRCVFLFLSIGREPTTWPENAYLQIMVCSCVIGYTFSREKMADQFPELPGSGWNMKANLLIEW